MVKRRNKHCRKADPKYKPCKRKGTGKKKKSKVIKRKPNKNYADMVKDPRKVFKCAASEYRKAGRPSGQWQKFVRRAWKSYHRRIERG